MVDVEDRKIRCHDDRRHARPRLRGDGALERLDPRPVWRASVDLLAGGWFAAALSFAPEVVGNGPARRRVAPGAMETPV